MIYADLCGIDAILSYEALVSQRIWTMMIWLDQMLCSSKCMILREAEVSLKAEISILKDRLGLKSDDGNNDDGDCTEKPKPLN